MRKIILLFSIFFLSCNASKKLVHTDKIDSVSADHLTKIESTIAKANSVSNTNYIKETTNDFRSDTVSSDYVISSNFPVLKKGDKQIIFLPVSTVKEWGNIAAAQNDSFSHSEKLNDNKTASLVHTITTKNVIRKHNLITFFLSLLFVVFCLIISFPNLRRLLGKAIKFINPIKYFL